MTGSSSQTLPQALERAAEHAQSGLRLLDRRERETWLPWRKIFRQGRRVAGGLRRAGVGRGETVGLFYPTGAPFFQAFFGVSLAGAVPAPFHPPLRLGRLAEYRLRTARMLASARVRWVLAHPGLSRILGDALAAAGCRSLTLSELLEAHEWVEEVDSASLALVQFSSGTTVEPKPVALSQRAVMTQARALNSFWPDRPGERHTGLSWLPLYHDMGLIGCVFTALERPSVLTLIPPEVFVARPAVWLRAISRFGATISAAPNFAFGLCAERIRDQELEGTDLSCWRVALNGGERVVPSVMRSFSERFSRWGFRAEAMTPVYGLSEASLAVTFSSLEGPFVSRRLSRPALADQGEAVTDPEGVEIVSVGHPLPGFEVEVRSDAGAALPAGRVGRVWVRGPSLMEGYLHHPEATTAALRSGWLDTGDLGFMSDGELYITGRAKDVVIVRGSNHSPEEIENVVEELPEVRVGCSAAVSHLPEGAEREQVWLFVEKRGAGDERGAESLAATCRRRVLRQTGIAVDHVEVLAPGTLPRTSSGKVRREETLKRFLAAELTSPRPVTVAGLLRAMGGSTAVPWPQREEG